MAKIDKQVDKGVTFQATQLVLPKKAYIQKFNESNPILSSLKIVCICALPAARAIRCNLFACKHL